MAAYYNENDPFAAQWLRELIKAGLIADGEVDERDIRDVQPADVRGFTQCHFFAGIGGWSYALRLAGWPDDRPVWTGSCPCQPFSSAGKGDGAADPRHLWPTWFRIIRERRPTVVFGEQVASADGLGWLDLVSHDLEVEDYAIGAADLCAPCVGAFDIRQRLWFVADADGRHSGPEGLQRRWEHGQQPQDSGSSGLADSERRATERPGFALAGAESGTQGAAQERQRLRDDARHGGIAGVMGDTDGAGLSERDAVHRSYSGEVGTPQRQAIKRASAPFGFWFPRDWIDCTDGKSRPIEPGSFPLADGVPARVGRLRGYGNAIKPQVAQAFIEAYLEAIA